MHEKIDYSELNSEIERENFVRAALLAEQMSLPEEEIKNLCHKALGQMSVIYRNPHGMSQLARQYGVGREELKKILKEFADEMGNEGKTKPLEPRYDHNTGKYLSFEEWLDHYHKI